MLQPREQNRIPFLLKLLHISLWIAFICMKTGLAQNSDDVYIVEPTPALRLNNQDLTTILLLNNNNNRRNYGRNGNVKPTVGLLTSTARTFIQEGVTTEYATQVLGTTLENGRLYAQLLKKSSRVIYDKDQTTISPTAKLPSIVNALPTYSPKSPKSLLQSHNDIIGDKDWQLIDDHLLLVSKDPVHSENGHGHGHDQGYTSRNIPRGRSSSAVYPANSFQAEREAIEDDLLNGRIFSNQSFSVSHSSNNRPFSLNSHSNISAQKVLHAADLPTYTVKNIFAPSGFSWDSPIDDVFIAEEKPERVVKTWSEHHPRAPKLLQHDKNILQNDLRNMVTTTYFGFADFTTIVGDTVIVFSPSTAADLSNLGQVTSIKGEATLNHASLKAGFVTHVPITVTQDLIEPTFTMQHVVAAVHTTEPNLNDQIYEPPSGDSADSNDERDQSELTMPEDSQDYNSDDETSAEEYVTTTEGEFSDEKILQKDSDLQTSTPLTVEKEHVELEPSTVSSAEAETRSTVSGITSNTKPMLSRPSNEDILKIFASLASVEEAKKQAAATSTAESIPNLNPNSAPEIRHEEKLSPPTTVPHTKEAHKEDEESSGEVEHVETTTFGSALDFILDLEKEQNTESSLEHIPVQPKKIEVELESSSQSETISSETKVAGGVTTIFFEDDPFLNFEATLTQQSSISISATATPSKIENSIPEKVTDSTEQIVDTTTELDLENSAIEIQSGSKKNFEEITDDKVSADCEEKTSEIIPTLVPKTLTYLTTFFISDAEETSTSVESNVVVTFDVSYSTKLYCEEIVSTPVVQETVTSTRLDTIEAVKNVPASSKDEHEFELSSSVPQIIDDTIVTTTPHMIVTEKVHVTTEQTSPTEKISLADDVRENENIDDTENNEENSTEDSLENSGEEIELIYKTLYTTYTYLTTFFHESTTSVSSRIEVITSVITSTISPILDSSLDVTELLASISPTTVIGETVVASTETMSEKDLVAHSDLVKIDDILRSDESYVTPTASLTDENVLGNSEIKTYYTTYTYFTTIFVDGETEIMSRTEVYTNHVTETVDQVAPSSREANEVEFTIRDDDNKIVNDIVPTATYNQPISTNSVRQVQQALDELLSNQEKLRQNVSPIESSLVSSTTSSSVEENVITMVTDIKSSSSDGDRQIIENINKNWNGFLEDQISSESNTEEILPSSTLLLQTSYTTFTYFTTMYIGSSSSNILSRLETITNVVTETLQPTQMLKAEDSTLPITYFTTFTYWTTLYKDGETTTISREETVSNVISPTVVLEDTATASIIPSAAVLETTVGSSVDAVDTNSSPKDKTPETVSETDSHSELMASTSPLIKVSEPTTFYTTYTYFTTQYIGEETVISSRFETVTNVNTPIVLDSTMTEISSASSSTQVIDPATPDLSVTPKLADDETIIEFNHGKIVDAEGISTLLYATKTIVTRISDVLSTIAVSTSSLEIDEVKKALISSTQTDPSSKTYKTGLVRLIDGTIVANLTTTLYQSKVIGTIIDGRYAQIIESTSSFLIEKTLAPSTPIVEISATSVRSPSEGAILQTAFTPTASSNIVEGSIGDDIDDKDNEQFEDAGDDDIDDNEPAIDESGRPKSRLTFQTRKKTFTPVIRPFASRNRPQFAPKRKNSAPGSATIITRSDFTPTITATPALKSESSRGRFSSNRKGSAINSNAGSASGSSRKFSRASGSSSLRSFPSSSSFQGGSRRGFASSRIQPTGSAYFGGSSRRGGVSTQRAVGGSSNFARPIGSSLFPGNSRLRIKPSSTITGGDTQTNSYTTQEPDASEENITQLNADQEQDDIETTENSRRPNSLLKLRRPPITAKSLGISQRRNPLTQRIKTTTSTTTTTPKPQPRAFQRPTLTPFGTRPRGSSGLFPPRGLFKPQTINEDLNANKKPQNEEENDFGDDLDGEDYNDDDGEDGEDQDQDRNRRNNIKRHVRAKRQAPSFRNRFRRPSKNEERAEPVDEEPVTQRSRTTARYNGARNNNKKSGHGKNNNGGSGRIRPTKASSSTRAQFTLREKDAATKPSRSGGFRRPTPSGSSGSRRTSTTIGRPKAPRLKSYSNSATEAPYTSRSTAGRSRQTTSRGRSTTRSRGTTEYKNNDPVLPAFDGTITVTHHIPTEITIPVVNGKLTEYKNIVTAQIRTEVLAPNQYNTLVDRAGSSLLVLSREESTINSNGATEVTQFILHETPTTSVIFTPTTIRGRRTSFSHVIPSTVYDVENVVSTIQPQIAAQAPLANILLSQLLLGNIGLPQQQLNPALIGLGQTGVPGTPTTEFKIRTTSYVTTVTNEMSTVIPLTFRADISISTTPLTSFNEKRLASTLNGELLDEEAISKSSHGDTGRFFNFQVFEGLESSTPALMGDEARYNLATRIMSNGVEVIVAGDKSKTAMDRNNVLRIVPSHMYKPMTLAPSTLKNQMILIEPVELKDNLTFAINPNQFVTKTCLTTYTYRTTYLQDGTTTIESREKVISNIATEERNYLKISATSASGVTLSRTPEFVIGVFHTTYTYLNTILDEGLPIILSSKHTVTNTITGPEDYISFLQPSEEATPMHETNTYYSKITLTKTLQENDVDKIVSTSNVLRQVVITESFPSKSTSVMTSYIALDSASNENSKDNEIHIYATKTYLTTFTYFTTVLKSQSQQAGVDTEVNSHIQVVENVVTESIPNRMLQQSALSDFRKQLQLTSTGTITTLATLVGGHTLEITAMKTPQLQQSSQVAAPFDNGNQVAESFHATSVEHETDKDDDEEEEEALISDESKDDENKDEVIEGDESDNIVAASSDHNEHIYNAIVDDPKRNKTKNIDKNGFQVSNLIGSFNLNGLNALGPVINAMAGLINTNFVAPVRKGLTNEKISINNISSKNLLKNISSLKSGFVFEHEDFESGKHRAPIYIPVRNTNDGGIHNNRLSSPASLHIAPPKPQFHHQQKYLLQSDEKANRNNKLEILVGKPTYETPLLNGGIPISPGEVITANSDVIIGKPAGVRPRIPFPNNGIGGDIAPPLYQSNNHPTSPKVIPLLSYPQQNQYYIRAPAQSPNNAYQISSAPSSQFPSQSIHSQKVQHYQQGRYPSERQPPTNNEILEIKRIPEVYSADFPVVEMKPLGNSEDKTMLVNIQPSQVASVMIPHGNTPPVLIIESTAELHKNGQYFDEPSPYPNTILGVDSDYNRGPNSESTFNKHTLTGSHEPLGSVSESASAPVQVNLDSSVLSHNIDVHVPPLTFIKENEFPQSTPIRGQIFSPHKNAPYNINFPPYNRHVHVNLRPQHELPNGMHFHHTHQYPVEGMEPPPENTQIRLHVPPAKKIPYPNNRRPYQPPQYHYQYEKPFVQNNNINNYNPFKENTFPNEFHGIPPKKHNPQSLPPHVYDTVPMSNYDNSPVDHSQAPSIVDGITDQHRDDDYENEEGEVIQESNSLPVIPGQYIDYPTSTVRSSPFNMLPFMNMPSASAINELPHMGSNGSKNHGEPVSWDTKTTVSLTSGPSNVQFQQNDNTLKTNTNGPTRNQIPNKMTPQDQFKIEAYRNRTVNNSGTDNRKDEPPQSVFESMHSSTLSDKVDNTFNDVADRLHAYDQAARPIGNSKRTTNKTRNDYYDTKIPATQTERPFDPNNELLLISNNSIISNDLEKDSEEIFDFKESMNPHNLQVINNLEELSSPALVETSSFTPPLYSDPTQISTVSTQNSPIVTTEEVVDMRPPPLPHRPSFNHKLPVKNSRRPQNPLQKYSTRVPPPSFNLMTRNSSISPSAANISVATPSTPVLGNGGKYTNVRSPSIIPWDKVQESTPSAAATSISQTKHNSTYNRKFTANPSVLFSIGSSVSSVPVLSVTKIRPPNPILVTRLNYSEKYGSADKKLPIAVLNSKLKISATPSIKVFKQSNMTHATLTASPRPNQIGSDEMLNDIQSFPDSILIAGSEPPLDVEKQTVSTSYFTHKETITVTKPLNFTTRTRLVSKIVLPTRYLTNTKTLTVTTTKTTVIKSQGIPSTQTLILTTTQTSTLVDTVTETQTQTQTLLQPTKVLLDPTTKTQIYNTVYTIPPLHNPEKEPTPPDEVVDDLDDGQYPDSTPGILKKPANISSSTSSPNPIIIRKGSPAIPSLSPTVQNHSSGQQESIFVVMTDQRNIGLIQLGGDQKQRPTSVKGTENTLPNGSDHSADSIDLPNRDEDTINGESNHVLLGGVLIATPPKASNNLECRPDCKGSRNELCQSVNGHMRCICRAGFARMFPDRPCKPTYTYQLSVPLQRFGKEMLVYNDSLSNKESESFFNLASITHEALDRMVMQSDFRDIYHGVHVTALEKASSGKGVVGKFYLQLSDNSDEQRLIDVFRKYLRSTNYSIGGTELHSAQTSGASGPEDLKASDFDECLDRDFHDCSSSAYCFNLHGTYTCSCKEGYADLSENPIYPGRICSTEQIGCEKCHYHGSCYSRDSSYTENVLCECFPWYAGASCQLNLKILLIALVAFGTLLLLLLFFCLLITCSKRRKNRSMQAIISGINILPPKGSRFMGSSDKLMKLDKRAMIKDSSSEASHSLDTLPYVAKKNYTKDSMRKQMIQEASQRHTAVSPVSDVDRHCNLLDQNDRSLTVMIPRAKYHPMTMQIGPDGCISQPLAVSPATVEAKLLSYWDVNGSNLLPPKKLSSINAKQHSALHTSSTGALVSAGFEVSATVSGQDRTLESKNNIAQKTPKSYQQRIAHGENHSQYSTFKNQPVMENNLLMDPMDAWPGALHQTELTASEVRSYDETTIQAQTKSLFSVYDKQLSHMNNDEANTMAERDIGSTFLLPHTHLYKPDRGSDDISGFDSF